MHTPTPTSQTGPRTISVTRRSAFAALTAASMLRCGSTLWEAQGRAYTSARLRTYEGGGFRPEVFAFSAARPERPVRLT
jgi:hypothetical protein